ncbi:uncharacterized protein J4E87_001035 [Alternaria ethzedia]|uniref:uncharacterized protein n=1 Tax=Alternaria ethzedia TaxID=181014 RepID=UPI0020C4C8FF|nr:uncharacterized protein J4E87_001035 [Alternaria ethzedia]KAI4614110.1 hypothetical protein J4E80_006801 [Alternaria sp. BMP 0032]KAI4633868.1 hypothetical protein J4E87_001035 [Alternaria ethzedia]
MSDTEGAKGKGWTDRQRLAYYFNLVEFSNVKLDFANAPRPDGKSVGACRIMVDRLKGTLKTDLAALRGVDEGDVVGPKKTPTPRKRKAKGDAGTEGEATPTKRGRKKKVAEEVVVEEDEDELTPVKPEPKEEDLLAED